MSFTARILMISRKLQNLLVVLAALLVLAIASLSFVFFAYNRAPKDPKYHVNVTQTDATLKCAEAVRNEFGDKLSNYTLDEHSSRADGYNYKIFYTAYVQKTKEKKFLNYISCYVRGRDGAITKFDIFEDKEEPEKAESLPRSGKFIEWPR